MLTSIEIKNTTYNPWTPGENIVIPIVGSTIANQFIVKNIDGLGPPPITVNMGALAGNGSIYQGRNMPNRNPVLTIGLNPDFSSDQTVAELRDVIYQALLEPAWNSPEVTIILHDDTKPDRTFSGYVESMDINQFSKSPDLVISILCPAWALSGTVTLNGAWDATHGLTTTNPGTAAAGFDLVVVNGSPSMTGFNITKVPDEIKVFSCSETFYSGDALHINSVPGSRKVEVYRAGVWHNIIDSMDGNVGWPSFAPGANTLSLDWGNMALNSCTYTSQWWGV